VDISQKGRLVPVIDLTPAGTNLSAVISAVPDDALLAPTPCQQYSVADLLDHIAGLTTAFGGAAAKADGESASMGPQGDGSNLDPDWRNGVPRLLSRLTDAWRDPAAWEGMTRVGGQDLPGEVAGTVCFGELTVHGWDLATATGLPYETDATGLESLLALVGQVFGPGQDAARGEAFGPAVPVPESASALDRVLGLLGRDPGWRPAT
jgi:uncharacterized protein (TIGR03086 family)